LTGILPAEVPSLEPHEHSSAQLSIIQLEDLPHFQGRFRHVMEARPMTIFSPSCGLSMPEKQ
jgi:hypothetical protein